MSSSVPELAAPSCRKKSASFEPTFARTARSAPATRTSAASWPDRCRRADAPHGERVSGKGDISRKRTVAGGEIVEDDAGHAWCCPTSTATVCRLGRVLRVQGLLSIVRDEAGAMFQCATRRLLKTLATDQRHVVAAGDVVWFRPEGDERGNHRARRAAARRRQPHEPRPAARARGQCRSARHRHERRRAAAQAEPDRPLSGHGREGRHSAGHLHQQDRPDRAGRPDAAGRRLRAARLRSAVGVGGDRHRHRPAARSDWRAQKASSPAKAASASRRC